jgi:hypothetical protein
MPLKGILGAQPLSFCLSFLATMRWTACSITCSLLHVLPCHRLQSNRVNRPRGSSPLEPLKLSAKINFSNKLDYLRYLLQWCKADWQTLRLKKGATLIYIDYSHKTQHRNGKINVDSLHGENGTVRWKIKTEQIMCVPWTTLTVVLTHLTLNLNS